MFLHPSAGSRVGGQSLQVGFHFLGKFRYIPKKSPSWAANSIARGNNNPHQTEVVAC